MPFCHNCGKEVAPGTKFCPECGAQLLAGPRPEKPSRPKAADTRPGVQKLLASLLLGLGFCILFLGVLFFIFAQPPNLALALEFSVFLMMVGLASAAGGYGLWKNAPWMMTAAGAAGGVYIVLGVLLAIGSTPWLLGEGALSFLLGAFSLLWARSPGLRSRYAKSTH